MKITEASIKNYPLIFLLIFGIVIFGLVAYFSMSRESFPEVKIPIITISTFYAGVAPVDIENLVTNRIEKELKGLSGVKNIKSTSAESMSQITVEFNPDVDIDVAYRRVKDKVDIAKPKLPDDAEEPIVNEVNVSEMPVLYVILSGKLGLVRLKKIADNLETKIEEIHGVLNVAITGGLEREIRVEVDPVKLKTYNLSLNDVVETIRREHITIPAGDITFGDFKYLIRVPGEAKTPVELKDWVIKNFDDNNVVKLGDIAQIRDTFKDRASVSHLNGEEAVTLAVIKRTGANILDVVDSTKDIVLKVNNKIGSQLETHFFADQSIQIRDMILELENSILSAFILVVLVLMIVMGIRNSLFVAIAIPLSMLISFIIIYFMGMTLNMIVLFSLIMALGMLVDNAIVVVENIYRHMQLGEDKITASIEGTKEVSMPIVASTLTTICAFGPIIFWPGIMGDFMQYLPKVLIISLSASLLVALVFNPTICSFFIKVKEKDINKKDKRLMVIYQNFLRKCLLEGSRLSPFRFFRNWLLFWISFFFLLAGIGNKYYLTAGLFIAVSHFILSFLTRHRQTRILDDNRTKFTYAVIIFAIATILVYIRYNSGKEFFPDIDPIMLFVNIEAPSGTSIESASKMVKYVEDRTDWIPDKKAVISNIGGGGPQTDIDLSGSGDAGKSSIIVDIKKFEERTHSSTDSLIELRKKLKDFRGARLDVDKPKDGPPTGKPINIEISGDDYKVLSELSEQIKSRIKSIHGIVNLQDDYDAGRPEIRVQIDRIRAGSLGLSTLDIASTIKTAVAGQEAGKYRVGEDEYDITVRFPEKNRKTLNDLKGLEIFKYGARIPIENAASFIFSSGPTSIHHVDLNKVITVSSDVSEEYNKNDVRNEVIKKLEKMKFPEEYNYKLTGENKDQEESQKFLSKAFLAALLLILLVMVWQFKSFFLPLTIMVSVVLSIFGVLWGLLIMQWPFGVIMTGIGVISLAGIVVNNAIVLVDFIEQLRARGFEKIDAIVEAGRTRMRPVLLTAITTMLGLIPLGVGINFDFTKMIFTFGSQSSQWWSSMCIAVIFGLFFATILTLAVVPVIYSLFDEIRITKTREK